MRIKRAEKYGFCASVRIAAVGLTVGAWTPGYVIDEVEAKLLRLAGGRGASSPA